MYTTGICTVHVLFKFHSHDLRALLSPDAEDARKGRGECFALPASHPSQGSTRKTEGINSNALPPLR